jgi:hypothetical protein
MAEIITCPKCDRKLQVPEQYLGQTVQCPECLHQFVAQQSAVSATPIPASNAPSSPPNASAGTTRRYDDGDEYDDLDVRRRRHDDDDDYPRHRPVRHDFAPHRAGLVMALGLVALVGGFAFCAPVIIGPIAWIMGSIDLRAMREGHMDPSGEGMTRSGQICGMIATIFLLLGTGLAALVFVAG